MGVKPRLGPPHSDMGLRQPSGVLLPQQLPTPERGVWENKQDTKGHLLMLWRDLEQATSKRQKERKCCEP